MKNLESKIQIEIVAYIRMRFRKSVLFSVPNGGQRSIITGAILKKEGVFAGVSDLIWINNGIVYFLEIKAEKGVQSDSQRYFQRLVEQQGFVYEILKSCREFDLFCKFYRIE